MQCGIAGFQHVAQRADAEAFSKTSHLGQFWRKYAVDQHQPTRAPDGVKLQGRARARQRRRVRRRRQRQHLAHQQAQIGVFPVLDAPVREANTLVSLECLPPVISDLACARQPILSDGEDIAQRVSFFGFGQYYVHYKIRN